MKELFDLVVVGESNIDMIVSGLDSLPSLGTEKIASKFEIVMGGSAANFACGAARLGLNMGFIGKVGNDDYGKFIIECLKKQNIDTTATIMESGIKTGITISFTFPQERAFVTYLGSIAALRMEEINLDYLKKAKHLHLSALFLQKELKKEVVSLFRLAKNSGLTTSLDPGFDPDEKWNSRIYDILKNTDVFLPNEAEALKISQKKNLDEALDLLIKYSKIIAVKLGEKGGVGINKEKKKIYRKAYKIKTVDTTGSGDSFNAGFIFGFLKGFTLEESLEFGNACGAISTTNVGGATSCPSLEEAREFINSHK